jgi:phage terminase large subunit-like protein
MEDKGARKRKLAELSREEKLQLYEALQEKKRRLKSQKALYVPNVGQMAVHLDDHPIRLVTSGNGSGKSTLLVNEVWWAATGYNPITKKYSKVPARVAVVLDSPAKIEEVFLQELRKWYNVDEMCEIHKKGKPYPSELVFKNGSKVTFLMHLMEPLALEGLEFDYAFFDEPPPRQVFLAIMRGNRRKGSRFNATIIGTPIAEIWLYDELYQPAMKGERPDIGVHRFSTEVNAQNLSDGYIDSFAKNLSEKEKQIRLHGEFYHLSGLALAHIFRVAVHVVEPFQFPTGKPVCIAIDPHPAKNHVALMCGATGDGRIYALKELSSAATPREFATELKEWMKDYNVIEIIVDSLGETPTSGGEGNRSFCDVLRSCGIRARSTSFDEKNDEAFIEAIRDVLEVPDKPDNFGRRQPKLAIFSTCTGLIHDMQTVAWLKHKNLDQNKPKLDIRSRDWLACLKYVLATNFSFISTPGSRPRIRRSGRSPWSGTPRR